MTTLKVGDKAPDFKLQTDDNKTASLKDYLGKKVLLYFYPKDNTPGCTKEACDFRDHFSLFVDNNVEILGISKDNPAKHQQFKKKYTLPFTLLTDDNADVCIAYGVMNEKSLFGRTFLGIQRSTFLIDEKGYIEAIWRKVKIKGHIQQVLDELS